MGMTMRGLQENRFVLEYGSLIGELLRGEGPQGSPGPRAALGRPRAALGRPWAALGPLSAALGPPRVAVGPPRAALRRPRAVLGGARATLGHSGAAKGCFIRVPERFDDLGTMIQQLGVLLQHALHRGGWNFARTNNTCVLPVRVGESDFIRIVV